MAVTINADTTNGLVITPDTSGDLSFQSSGSNIFTIDSSGNTVFSGALSWSGDLAVDTNTLYVDATNNRVGIGTSSPDVKLQISDGSTTSNSKARIHNVSNADTNYGASLQFTNEHLGVVRNLGEISALRTNSLANYSGYLTFSYSNNSTITEKMRLDEYGLHVGNTNLTFAGVTVDIANIPSGEGVGIKAAGVGNYMIEFRNSSGVNCGTIVHNTSSSVSYNTSSDYRLKENTTNINNGISRVKLLKPYRFNYITDPDIPMDGFYAHEVQDVVPEAIHGIKDAVDDEGNPVYQGIDQSKLVPLLTAALQEAITKIEDLETRIQALENA